MAPLSASGEMPESAANFRAKARLPQAVPAWPHRAGREVPAILRGVVPTSLAIRATGAVPWRADGALAGNSGGRGAGLRTSFQASEATSGEMSGLRGQAHGW
jgi:hypothetical protein